MCVACVVCFDALSSLHVDCLLTVKRIEEFSWSGSEDIIYRCINKFCFVRSKTNVVKIFCHNFAPVNYWSYLQTDVNWILQLCYSF